MLRAAKVSWGVSFISFVFLEVVSKDLVQYSSSLFLQVGLAIMLCTQGAAFLVMNREDPVADEMPHA